MLAARTRTDFGSVPIATAMESVSKRAHKSTLKKERKIGSQFWSILHKKTEEKQTKMKWLNKRRLMKICVPFSVDAQPLEDDEEVAALKRRRCSPSTVFVDDESVTSNDVIIE